MPTSKPPLKVSDASVLGDVVNDTDQVVGLRLSETDPDKRNVRWTARTWADYLEKTLPSTPGGPTISAALLARNGANGTFVLSPAAPKVPGSYRWLLPISGGVALLPALTASANRPAGIAAPGLPYLLPAAGAVAAGTAQVSEYSRTAVGGQYIQLSAEKLSSAATSFQLYAGGQLYTAAPAALAGQLAQVLVPAAVAFGLLVLWPVTPAGVGAPLLVNRAEATWMESKLVAGKPFRVYGNNLLGGSGSGTSNVYLSVAGAPAVACQVTEVTPEYVTALCPASAPQEVCQVWVHPGQGGDFNWSEPLQSEVVSAQAHPRWRNWGTVQALDLTGTTDAGAAINAAAQALGAGRLTLSAGTYPQVTPVEHRQNVLLDGATDGQGNPATTLQAVASYAQDDRSIAFTPGGVPTPMLGWRNTVFDVHLNAPASTDRGVVQAGTVSDFLFDNCRINAPGWQCLRFADGTARVYSDNYRFVGLGNLLQPCSQVHFTNFSATFTGNSDEAFLLNGGQDGVSFIGGTVADLDSNSGSVATQGIGRIIHLEGTNGSLQHIHASGIVGTNLGPNYSLPANSQDRNKGEEYMGEGFRTSYFALATASTATTVQLASTPTNDLNSGVAPGLHLVYIAKGTGFGQVRALTAHDGAGQLTVDAPWNVQPDATSTIYIGKFCRYFTVVGNTSTCKPGIASAAQTDTNAVCLVEPFGGCFHWLARRNSITGARYGASVCFTQTAADRVEPVAWMDFSGNTFSGCTFGEYTQAANDFQTGQGFPVTAMLGVRFSRNTITSSVIADTGDELPRVAADQAHYTLPIIALRQVSSLPANYYCQKYGSNFPAIPSLAGATACQLLDPA